MAEPLTSCRACPAEFKSARGLAVHLAQSGHAGLHHAREAIAAFAASEARPIPCTYPGCGSSFRSKRGLRIHTAMRAHQPPADTFTPGDGPEHPIRVRGPAKGAEPEVEVIIEESLEQQTAEELAVRPTHPSVAGLRLESEEPAELESRIEQILRSVARTDDGEIIDLEAVEVRS